MLPGIIPIGVTTPAFTYKEGYVGTLADGDTATISMTTSASPYRWVIISAGFGQSSTNSSYVINISVNGSGLTEIYAATNSDRNGTGSVSTSHVPVRVTSGSSFTLSLSNGGGFAMSYTVGVFEIPSLGMQVVANTADYGSTIYSLGGPQYRGGLVIVSQMAQGGGGTWSDMLYTGSTKIPVESSVQESLAYAYPQVDGTFDIVATNGGTYNRILAVSTWAPS